MKNRGIVQRIVMLERHRAVVSDSELRAFWETVTDSELASLIAECQRQIGIHGHSEEKSAPSNADLLAAVNLAIREIRGRNEADEQVQ